MGQEDIPTKAKSEFDNTIVAIWAKAVDTQMHFNEMSVKSRQLGLTFVAAALGLAVFLFSRSGSDARFAFSASMHGHQFEFHVAEFIILAAAASVYVAEPNAKNRQLRNATESNRDSVT